MSKGKVIEMKQPETPLKPIIITYKYFYDVKEFEEWQRKEKPQINSVTQARDNNALGIFVLYLKE